MQIISKIPTDSYLVKLTENELANLLGFYSIYTDNAIDSIKSLISTEKKISISTIFQNALLFNDIKNAGAYDKVVKKLKDIIKALSPIDLLFDETDLTKLEKK